MFLSISSQSSLQSPSMSPPPLALGSTRLRPWGTQNGSSAICFIATLSQFTTLCGLHLLSFLSPTTIQSGCSLLPILASFSYCGKVSEMATEKKGLFRSLRSSQCNIPRFYLWWGWWMTACFVTTSWEPPKGSAGHTYTTSECLRTLGPIPQTFCNLRKYQVLPDDQSFTTVDSGSDAQTIPKPQQSGPVVKPTVGFRSNMAEPVKGTLPLHNT